MNIELDTNVDEVAAWVRLAFSDQLPYATSRAINKVAILAQEKQRAHQEEVFHITRKTFMDRAVKIKPFSTKHTLEAKIQIMPPGGESRMSIITKFEEDRWKTPFQRASLWVPHRSVLNSKDRVRRGWRPKDLNFKAWKKGSKAKVLRGDKRTFAILYRGERKGFIFEREGDELILLYSRHPRVRIEPVLKFEENVREVVMDRFDAIWTEQFTFAIRTARVGRVTPGARRMAALMGGVL